MADKSERPSDAAERDHAAAVNITLASESGDEQTAQEHLRMREAQIDAGD